MNNLEIYKLRIKTNGATNKERMLNDKKKSFESALESSYNANDFEKEDKTPFRAIISPNKLTLDYDEKVLAAPFSANLKVGDTIKWISEDNTWIVILDHLTEESYFRAQIKKALYELKWRGDDGKIYSQWAAVRGPVETKITQESKTHLTFDKPNNTLVLWFGANEATKYLERYEKIMVADKVWEISVLDDISVPGLMEMHLKEDIKDEDRDNIEEGIARDEEHMLVKVEPLEYLIDGLTKTNPLIGLEQTFTVTPFDEAGTWSIDPKFGTIISSSGSEVVIEFNGKTGITEISYSVGEEIKSNHKINITTMLG